MLLSYHIAFYFWFFVETQDPSPKAQLGPIWNLFCRPNTGHGFRPNGSQDPSPGRWPSFFLSRAQHGLFLSLISSPWSRHLNFCMQGWQIPLAWSHALRSFFRPSRLQCRASRNTDFFTPSWQPPYELKPATSLALNAYWQLCHHKLHHSLNCRNLHEDSLLSARLHSPRIAHLSSLSAGHFPMQTQPSASPYIACFSRPLSWSTSGQVIVVLEPQQT